MISKNIYAEIFFKINCISCLSVVIRVFKKSGFYPKILSCAEMQFLEIRNKVKNHHISEAGVSFEIYFGLCIKIWTGEHIFYIYQQTIALISTESIVKEVIFSGAFFPIQIGFQEILKKTTTKNKQTNGQ